MKRNQSLALAVVVCSSIIVAAMVVVGWTGKPVAAGPQKAAADDDDDSEDEESEEAEEREREQLEMRMHRMRLELERAELELRAVQLELVQRVTRTAEQEVSAAVYGVCRVQEFMEPEEAAEFLQELYDEVGPVIVKRAIRMKLVELFRAIDRPEDARSQIRSMIVGD
jgi:hypothetical protein